MTRPRHVLSVLSALAMAAMVTLVPTAARAADPGLTWRATGSPFALTFLDHGRPLTGERGDAAGPGGRLSYRVAGDARDHRLTDVRETRDTAHGTTYEVATDEPGRTATVAVDRTASGLRVRWTLTPATGVTAVFESLSAGGDEHYLSGSSATSIDVRGEIRGWSPSKEGREAGEYCQNQEQAASPFYLSSGGYGIYADTSHIGRFAFPGAAPADDGPTCARTAKIPEGAQAPEPCPVSPTPYADRVQICVKAASLTYHVYAGTPGQVTNGYYRTVGMPGLPPPGQFALMKWRDVNAGQAQVIGDVKRMRDLGMPVGTIWIDNPWQVQPPGSTDRYNGSACVGSNRFDPTLFPHPKAMIDEIHGMGTKFGLWVAPHVDGPDGCAPYNGSWARNGWMIPGTNYIDFTNPAARAAYVRQLTDLFRLGVDMTKEDRAEEWRLEPATFFRGTGATEYLRYPDRYQSAVSEALRRVNGENFQTLVRAGVPGTAQHTHGIWGSDSYQDFAALRTELRYGISESLTGHFAWGSDTGGIDPAPGHTASDSPSAALMSRWAQFSAISPVFEIGGAGLNATPWRYDAATVRRIRDAVTLHTELFPYLYGLARRASRTGEPIMRALGYQYPHDAEAWKQDQEVMVGPDLLAAPVTADRAEADGAAGRATPVSVYLPAGRWVDLYSGETVTGGRTITRTTTPDEFPLYLRAGAAIGFNARTPIWSDGWSPADQTKPGLSGWLYAPTGRAGSTADPAPGTATPASGSAPGSAAASAADPAPGRAPGSAPSAATTSASGSAPGGASGQAGGVSSGGGRLTGASAGRTVRLTVTGGTARAQIRVLGDEPRAVRVDGRVLPHAATAADLRGMRQGWTYTPGPFGGATLKLTPARGHAAITLEES